MEFKDLQKLVYEEYKKNGFEEYFNKYEECGDLAEIGLIASEIGEALDYIRDSKEIKYVSVELADIVIRVLNFCNRKNIDLEFYIIAKNRINKMRDKYHNKKVV